MCRLSPKVDIAFRKLFGSEENKDILRGFINSVLPAHEQIEQLEIKNPYNIATYVSGKGNILDIKARAFDGRYIDVELQVGEQYHFGKRIKYYLDKIYVDQLEVGGMYSTLKKVIGISLLDFNYFKDARYVRGVTFKDHETNETYDALDLSDMYFIEMRKFDKDLCELTTALDRWITFMNRAHEYGKDRIPPELSVDTNIESAIRKLDVLYLGPEEREFYDEERKKRLDQQETLRTAEANGIEIGKGQGIEIGKEEGREEGRISERKALALAMLKDGEPMEKILRYTHLSEDDIETLRSTLP